MGGETGNETRISRINTNFIGDFEDFGKEDWKRTAFALEALRRGSYVGNPSPEIAADQIRISCGFAKCGKILGYSQAPTSRNGKGSKATDPQFTVKEKQGTESEESTFRGHWGHEEKCEGIYVN